MPTTTYLGKRGRWTWDGVTRRGGGEAEIFRCVGPRGRIGAVKRARGSGRAVERERELLLGLHPDARRRLPQLIDHGIDGATAFLVFPWYPWNLETWCSDVAPDASARLAACAHATAAVAGLHRLSPPHVHGDVKPENFLIRQAESRIEVVLADLGATRAEIAVPASTVRHTPSYAAPEVAVPIAPAPGPAADVFSLAATVYAVLVGRVPEGIATAVATAEGRRLCLLHALGERRDPAEDVEYDVLRRMPFEQLVDLDFARSLTPADERRLDLALGETAPEMLSALRAALEPHPMRRTATATSMLEALERLTGPVPFPEREPPLPRSLRPGVALIAAVLGPLALGTAIRPYVDVDRDGIAPADGDCEDGDQSIGDGKPERRLDGRDEDCDGTVDRVEAAALPYRFDGERAIDEAGYPVVGADLDGNGSGDLVISAHIRGVAAGRRGAVYLVPGPLELGVSELGVARRLEGPEGAGIASALAVGELDGDDTAPELVLSGSYTDEVWILRGGPSFAEVASLDQAWIHLRGEEPGALFGSWLTVGDVDNDRRNDLIVSSVAAGGRSGRTQVFSGGNAFEEIARIEGTKRWEEVGAVISFCDHAGNSPGHLILADGSDADGGGADGLVRAWTDYPHHHLDRADAPDYTLSGSGQEDFGASLACGDVDDDGIEDLLVGAPTHDGSNPDEGAAYLFLGASPLPVTRTAYDAVATWRGASARAAAGLAVSIDADLDADGLRDLAIGAPYTEGRTALEGATAITFSGGPGPSGTFVVGVDGPAIVGSARFDNVGFALSGGPDVTGDGLDDLWISGGQREVVGRVWVFPGGL